MKFSDLLTGLFLVLLGGGVTAYGYTLPPMPGQVYGAGLFPTLIGVCLAGFGLHLARQGFIARQMTGMPFVVIDDWARDHRLLVNMALVLILIVAYVLFSTRIGFIPMSLGILMILFWRLGVEWKRNVLVALLATAFIQVSFSNILRVPLPRGLLDRVLWW
jgi:putative tricarboxylic transport membrane protein